MSDIAPGPTALKPLDPRLCAEVREWVTELRKIWGATGLSMNRFAALHPVDKGTLSRYLNGQRVPGDRWFLDQLLTFLAGEGQAVTPAVRQHLTMLHLRALQTAHPHEYRVRLVRDELEIALTGKREAERYARALEEQLAERNREIQELAEDKGRLREAWNAEYDRLTREIRHITRQLDRARERATWAEQRCRKLEDLLDQLDSLASPDEDADDASVELEKAKDRFMATTINELRTPVTVVEGFANTLVDRWGRMADQDRRAAVQTIADRASSLSRLVERVLLSMRSGPDDRLQVAGEPFDLAAVICGAAHSFQSQSEKHSMVIDIPDDLPQASGDTHATDIILGQLLENAIKYSPDGGAVHLRARVVEGWIEVMIDDEGIGIAGDDLERIFDRFVQGKTGDRRFGGVGIGLYIARNLARKQNGEITAECRPAGGTSMRLRLRLAAGAGPASQRFQS